MLNTIYLRQPSRHKTYKQRRSNVDVTTLRHIDVDTTLFRRHLLARRGHSYGN